MQELKITLYILTILVSIPSVIIWNWFFKKIIRSDTPLKLTSWLATFAMMPVIYKLIVVPWYLGLSFFPSRNFNKEKWHSVAEKRYEMSEDIIDRDILIGKTKTDIQLLLGKAENTSENNQWEYVLGSRPGLFVIYPDILQITFQNEKAVKVRWIHPVQMSL